MKTQLTLIALFAMTTFCQFPIPGVFPGGILPGSTSPPRPIPPKRKCPNRPMLNMGNMNGSDFELGISAIGFQYDSGAMWAAVCMNTPKGNVPCKVHADGRAFYAWGGQEFVWNGETDMVYGELVSNKARLPCGCKPRGHQTNDNNDYYNAVIPSNKGLIPGKAKVDRSMAWYGWGLKEHYVRDNFYIIC